MNNYFLKGFSTTQILTLKNLFETTKGRLKMKGISIIRKAHIRQFNVRSCDYLHSTSPTCSILAKIASSGILDENLKLKQEPVLSVAKKNKKTKSYEKYKNVTAPEKSLNGSFLGEYFAMPKSNFPFQKVNKVIERNISNLMLSENIKLDRSIYKYSAIPGIPKEQTDEFEDIEEDPPYSDIENFEGNESHNMKMAGMEIAADTEELDSTEKQLDISVQRYLEKKENAKREAIHFNNLPEVLLIGRCNVGKSSLINALLSHERSSTKNMYAKVKDHAGYTPCLNFYNIGNRLRLVDSPGYGLKGKIWQGNLVFEYLEKRKVLRRCYLLLDSKIGVTEYDELIIQKLVELGVEFDIIFTKIDKLISNKKEYNDEIQGKIIEHFDKLIDESILSELRIKPLYYFTNAIVDSSNSGKRKETKVNSRTGILEIRSGILSSCGYDMSKPVLPIKRSTPTPAPKDKKKDLDILKK